MLLIFSEQAKKVSSQIIPGLLDQEKWSAIFSGN